MILRGVLQKEKPDKIRLHLIVRKFPCENNGPSTVLYAFKMWLCTLLLLLLEAPS